MCKGEATCGGRSRQALPRRPRSCCRRAACPMRSPAAAFRRREAVRPQTRQAVACCYDRPYAICHLRAGDLLAGHCGCSAHCPPPPPTWHSPRSACIAWCCASGSALQGHGVCKVIDVGAPLCVAARLGAACGTARYRNERQPEQRRRQHMAPMVVVCITTQRVRLNRRSFVWPACAASKPDWPSGWTLGERQPQVAAGLQQCGQEHPRKPCLRARGFGCHAAYRISRRSVLLGGGAGQKGLALCRVFKVWVV